MFAIQNLNLLLNVPQLSTIVKSGMFQYSSLNSIKKIADFDAVFNEFTHTVQFIKDLKCEKIVDMLVGVGVDTNQKNLELRWLENLILKLSAEKKRISSDVYAQYEDGIPTYIPPSNDFNKLSEIIESDKYGKHYFQTLPKNNSFSSIQSLWKTYLECYDIFGGKKKSSVHFYSFSNSSNISFHNIFKNSGLYYSAKDGFQLGKHNKKIFEGQKRGFKTERGARIELDKTHFKFLNNLGRIFKRVNDHGRIGGKVIRKNNEMIKVDSSKNAGETTKIEVGGREHIFLPKDELSYITGYLAGKRRNVFDKYIFILSCFRALFRTLYFFIIISLLYVISENSFFYNRMGHVYQTSPETVNVTFNDVKGADEAKEELRDIVEFLRNPSKLIYLGGKLPSGVLLEGPPGTGKTLLARAVAGEANVPFFHVCASEFDEYLVGEGARRVRNLFKAAKERAPAVIFIDEIDAVGSKRIRGGIHPHANQTINQLLAEMDGFVKNEGVIVIGATNREQDLDKALLRPGRFDLKVRLLRPDIKGRKDILELYLSKIISKNVDVDRIAKSTMGFAGADLENIVNQAALRAATCGSEFVTTEHLEFAFEKMVLGPERKSAVTDEQTNLVTAYHESGHATVAYFTQNTLVPVKVTIIPRNKTLGHTTLLHEKEGKNLTKAELLGIIDIRLGGRAAEELMFGPDKISSGCENDIKGATFFATQMVRSWGMSEKIGVRTHLPTNFGQIQVNEWGQNKSNEIDDEIQKILQESYERAKNILKKHEKAYKRLAETLLQKETLDAEEIKTILREEEQKEEKKKKMTSS